MAGVMAQYELPNNIIECSICRDTIEKNSKKLIKCNHKFHKECIERWKDSCNDNCIYECNHTKCPYCRVKIKIKRRTKTNSMHLT